jgi:hypothetical protein
MSWKRPNLSSFAATAKCFSLGLKAQSSKTDAVQLEAPYALPTGARKHEIQKITTCSRVEEIDGKLEFFERKSSICSSSAIF